MACGTPVICSNRTSLPEVAGDAAVLVDPDQPECIASAFVDLIHDREKYRNLSQAGLKTCGTIFLAAYRTAHLPGVPGGV